MADSGEAGPSEQNRELEEQEEEKDKDDKRCCRERSSGFYEIKRREIGRSQPRISSRRIGGSEAIIKRMTNYGKLHGHRMSVNTVSFNPTGDILISGSDDKNIIFWDWSMRQKTFSYDSGHLDNVFQARIMPFTDNSTLVSSAADGQVRVGQIKEGADVSTKQIGSHVGGVHQMAIEPGSPHIFYTCGEDGLVQHFDLRMPEPTKLFTCSPISTYHRNYIPLTTIAIDPRNPNFFSIGGSDQFARVFDIRSYTKSDPLIPSSRPVNTFCPTHLIKPSERQRVRITGLSYSSTSELLVSYSDELVYNFQKDTGLGPDPLGSETDPLRGEATVYEGHRNNESVKGVSYLGMRDEYVVSGSDCGFIYIWRKKDGELLCMVNGDKHVVSCVETHPYFPFLASSGLDKSVKIWTPSACRNIPFPKNAKEVMDMNKSGRESMVGASPDIIMHVLRFERRQAIAFVEHRNRHRHHHHHHHNNNTNTGNNNEGDDDNDDVNENEEEDSEEDSGRRETIIVGFANHDVDSEDEDEVDHRGCVIS